MWRLPLASMLRLHSMLFDQVSPAWSPPTATGMIVGSTARIASTTCRCFSTYFSIGMWPSCQSPYISLPIAQSLMPKGAGLPFSARRRPIAVVTAPFAYCTSSAAPCGPPRPVLTATYGSAPSSRMSAMNSCRPTSFDSMPFQAGFLRGGRRSRSPIPSCQS